MKNWARLIQKIYGVDPLTCPRGGGHPIFPLHNRSQLKSSPKKHKILC
jgi:hypothetical protein